MIQPKYCYLAMFDIIGFKALRADLGTSGLFERYKRGIQPLIEHSAAGKGKTVIVEGQSIYVPDPSEFSVKYKIVSDSVILYTENDLFESFFSIINSSLMLLQSGFIGSKAPYRGAIAHGDLIDDPDGTYIGSAVENAYIGESSQVWAGCMLTKECEKYAETNGYITKYLQTCPNKITEYDVPMQQNPKDSTIKYYSERHYVLNWTIRMYEGAGNKSFNDSEQDHAKRIKQNTIDFENWARANNN